MTPLSTISPDEGSDEIFRLIKGNDQCRLPCWGGIIPGQTDWDRALYLLHPFTGFVLSQEIDLHMNRVCIFGACNHLEWLYGITDLLVSESIYFTLPENIVRSISFEAIAIPTLNGVWVKDILSQYGSPSLVLIAVNPYSPDGFGAEVFTNLMLVYPDYQFIIVYSFDAQIQGDEFVSCNPNNNFRLEILSSDADISSFDRMNSAPILSEQMRSWSNGFRWYPIENVTNLTTKEFVEEYTTEEIPCFATPIDIWR